MLLLIERGIGRKEILRVIASPYCLLTTTGSLTISEHVVVPHPKFFSFFLFSSEKINSLSFFHSSYLRKWESYVSLSLSLSHTHNTLSLSRSLLFETSLSFIPPSSFPSASSSAPTFAVPFTSSVPSSPVLPASPSSPSFLPSLVAPLLFSLSLSTLECTKKAVGRSLVPDPVVASLAAPCECDGLLQKRRAFTQYYLTAYSNLIYDTVLECPSFHPPSVPLKCGPRNPTISTPDRGLNPSRVNGPHSINRN
ncbi:unnamed protein product [Acanthosepion pharaonis]|uniref:Uncharacterized protein n=1 Tax=Acanthosepion pharaonis TaxID=158019 RepID=A0A812ESS9_ACAPH|nr:unnamed protein product [Sepia pharaonis]